MTHYYPRLNWGMIAAVLFSLSVWSGVIWAIVHHFGGGIRMALFGIGMFAAIVILAALGFVCITWRKDTGGEWL